ncbi:uncharacterized protein BBA_07682 [Beauveria bassiana ARSEF 2860]|uniref:Uncharacterized protein n=1 Tax=Beauveria bassiana (strain ARSEF 2860) TaxID=655819 RepID=J5JAY1_BEAB2|nr:uncharacterized protein BBA_07682 [Beauveria bassiana ARSEF 2860]EJP63288.1 hypothetical protein BBA_07682 [Beauveria bassiana ARSEF 2860]
MAIVPPEGLETHQTVAIPRNLAIVATNYTLAQWLSGQSKLRILGRQPQLEVRSEGLS